MIETAKLVLHWLSENEIKVELLNLGGFGIKYVEGDESFLLKKVLQKLLMQLKKLLIHNYEVPEIGIEPGRSIVGEAGITLYEVGTIKEIPGSE